MKLWAITRTTMGRTTLYREARPYGFVNVVAFISEDEAKRFATLLNTEVQAGMTVYRVVEYRQVGRNNGYSMGTS